MKPFNTGKLYRFRKMKPALCPIYVRINNEWKGTTNGIVDKNGHNFDHMILLCLDSIHHDNDGYSGIFLAGDNIVGIDKIWVTEL